MDFKVLATIEEDYPCGKCGDVIPEGELCWIGKGKGTDPQPCECIQCHYDRYGIPFPAEPEDLEKLREKYREIHFFVLKKPVMPSE